MRRCLWIMLAFLLLWQTGCGRAEDKKVEDVAFTIVPQQEVPPELQKAIDEKKAEEFQLTYSAGNALYIVKGYGEQKTGGYSSCVPEFYRTQSSLVAKIDLIGPENREAEAAMPDCPYIVIKTQYSELPVKLV